MKRREPPKARKRTKHYGRLGGPHSPKDKYNRKVKHRNRTGGQINEKTI